MSKKFDRFCIAIWGDVDLSSDLWLSWLEFCENFLKEFSLEPNYIGVGFTSSKSTKAKTYKRSIKKIKERILSGEEVISLSLSVVPKDFSLLAIDWEIKLTRYSYLGSQFIFLGFTLDFEKREVWEEWVEKLKVFIHPTSIQFFIMDNRDSPLTYVMGCSEKVKEKVKVIYERTLE